VSLAAFLTARLEEDEAAARAACGNDWRPGGAAWILRGHPSETQMIRTDAGLTVVYDEGSPSEDEAAHIARHDPARVLREVKAHHALVGAYSAVALNFARVDETCCEYSTRTALEGACTGLAAIWEDHPDYRQPGEWAP